MKYYKLFKYNKYIKRKDYVIGYATNTNNKFYIDIEDYEKIKEISWYETSNGYICHKDTGKKVIFLHRFITNAPEKSIVDHINHNKKDNRKYNLRITNYKINGLNRKKLPNGICKHKVGNNYYYSVFLTTYRGNFKEYKDAKRLRDEIIEKEYKSIRRRLPL